MVSEGWKCHRKSYCYPGINLLYIYFDEEKNETDYTGFPRVSNIGLIYKINYHQYILMWIKIPQLAAHLGLVDSLRSKKRSQV